MSIWKSNFSKQKNNSPGSYPGKTVLGNGFRMDCASHQRPAYRLPEQIAIEDDVRKTHFFGFGTTRVGKTRLIEHMVTQDIEKGYNVAVIDPKGDHDLLAKIVEVARRTGRLDELMFISAVFPEYSMTIDPLAHYYMPEELVAHIISGVQFGKEPFFYNVAYEISIAIVSALLMTDVEQKGKPFNLTDIKNYASREALERLSQRVKGLNTVEARQLLQDLEKITKSPPDYYGKVSSSLRVALMELTSGNIGKIVGLGHQNKFIERLENGEPVILIVHLGSLMTRKAAYTLGKVIISMIQSFVGRIFSSGRQVSPPLCLYMDESQNLLYVNIDDLFAKAGGANVWVHAFAQSVSQLTSAVGQDYARAMLDNTNTKLFMRVPDPKTAEYATEHFGVRKKYSGLISGDGGVTMREEEAARLRPDELMQLGPREFLLMTFSGNYKGMTLQVDPSNIFIEMPYAGAVRVSVPPAAEPESAPQPAAQKEAPE